MTFLQVLQKWGEYSSDVQFILQRSALDPANKPATNGPMSPPAQRSGKILPGGQKSQSVEPPAVWKPPPNPYAPTASGPNGGVIKSSAAARLSPDSGRGSDKTGSDSSYHENNTNGGAVPRTSSSQMNGGGIPRSASASQMPGGQNNSDYGFSKQQSMPALRPPAYRPPPGPSGGANRNSSPADPPPYREPPPPESRYGSTTAAASSSRSGLPTSVRPPHYSPPPTHRTPHLSRHPSRTSLAQQHHYQQQQQIPQGRGYLGQPQSQPHGLPYRQPPSQQQMQQPLHYKTNTFHVRNCDMTSHEIS